jgi:hypothetical protein
MRDPPESTAVKAPLSAANFSESSAVYLARETASSSSASKMRSFFSHAAGAAPSVAMAAAGRTGEGEDQRRALEPILRRLLAGTRSAGGELRPVRGGWRGMPRFAPFMSRWTVKGWTFLLIGLFSLSTPSRF